MWIVSDVLITVISSGAEAISNVMRPNVNAVAPMDHATAGIAIASVSITKDVRRKTA